MQHEQLLCMECAQRHMLDRFVWKRCLISGYPALLHSSLQ